MKKLFFILIVMSSCVDLQERRKEALNNAGYTIIKEIDDGNGNRNQGTVAYIVKDNVGNYSYLVVESCGGCPTTIKNIQPINMK